MLVREYINYDAHDLALLIKDKQVSPKEVLACAQERMQEVNDKLNAVTSECFDFAEKCLARMDGNEPYYGVPLLVKDLGFALEGTKLTQGSQFFSNTISNDTSDFINKMMSLGFVPFARTNTPELGLSYVTESRLLGPCRNPFDLRRTPGGSSGGSAAAVAVGIAPVATASDGGGSIRIPAACCGLFGFKPTPGLTPAGPWVSEQWSGMATDHVLTRSVRDSSDVFVKIVQSPQMMPKHHKKSLVITQLEGVFAEVPIAQPCLEALEKGKDLLRKAGHTITSAHLDLNLTEINQCTLVLIAANVCAVIEEQQKIVGRTPTVDELEPITWEFYQLGKRIAAYELIIAKNKLYHLLRPLHQLLEHTDVVLTPALAQLPLLIGQLKTDDEFYSYLQKNTEFSPFTSLFNQAGLPAMTVPVMFHSHLPCSIQLGASAGHDLELLKLAEQIQQLTPDMAQHQIPF